jgi:hypothetical protein
MIKNIGDNYRILWFDNCSKCKKDRSCYIMDFQTPLLNHLTILSLSMLFDVMNFFGFYAKKLNF